MLAHPFDPRSVSVGLEGAGLKMFVIVHIVYRIGRDGALTCGGVIGSGNGGQRA
ncbi:hypothetical protein D3C85_1817630 [compost metagenome]